LNLSKFTKIETNYKSIAIRSILSFALLIMLFEIEIFVFWGIFGEGASASRISDLWYVELIFDYLPIAIIVGYLAFKVLINYGAKKYIESKTNIIVLVVLLLLFVIQDEILKLIF